MDLEISKSEVEELIEEKFENEEITKEEYDRRMSQIKIKTNVGMIISASEDEDLSIDSSMECKSGHCPIR